MPRRRGVSRASLGLTFTLLALLGPGVAGADAGGLKAMWGDVQVAVEKILFATSLEDVRNRTLSGRGRGTEMARVGELKAK